MKLSSIISIINKLNRKPNYKNCIKHSISNNVELAHIWINNPFYRNNPQTFFLIKNDSGYVGAVLDMINDLHWVILPEYRKKGYLTNALKAAIIPYLFINAEREELNISISELEIGKKNYNASMSTALKAGFKKVDDKSLILEEKDFDFSNDEIDIKYKGLTNDQIKEISKELKGIVKKVSVK